MPFPLPLGTEFRKELIESWILDAEDRVNMGDLEGASLSLSESYSLLMSLPPGKGDSGLELRFIETRVKIDRYQTKPNYENNH